MVLLNGHLGQSAVKNVVVPPSSHVRDTVPTHLLQMAGKNAKEASSRLKYAGVMAVQVQAILLLPQMTVLNLH